MINLSQYQQLIHLNDEFSVATPVLTEVEESNLVELILRETAHLNQFKYFNNRPLTPREELYARLITCSPFLLSDITLKEIDILFAYEKSKKSFTEVSDLRIQLTNPDFSTTIALWQGDISILKADAIVNAANNRMLGCFQPFHKCIDNVIHAAAGSRLRDDCAAIMNVQKKLEETGNAKITRGYHLPSKYVLHTVGPIYENPDLHTSYADLLGKCYNSCLNISSQIPSIKTLAFCCISTGVFGFPNEAASQIATDSVTAWLKRNPKRFSHIIFNVFLDEDYMIYRNKLKF